MFEIIIFTLVFIVSYAGVGILRRWSLRRGFLDVPNERSSHTAPTPSGGGAVIAAVCLIFYLFYMLFTAHTVSWAFLLGGGLIAGVSWLDDAAELSFIWRIAAHSAAALLIILTLGSFNQIYLPFFHSVELGKLGIIVTFLWIVGLTNAYNFMDGIDGLAGTQAVTAGIGWLLIGKMLGFEDISFLGGVTAFSALGFLLHNWQPAQIFMGDVGSAFLGFTFAVIPLLAESTNNADDPSLPTVAAGLVALFVLDTGATLVRRLFNREKIWRAHRSHFYQRLVIKGYSHQSVTLIYGTVSALIVGVLIFWLHYKS